MSALALKTSKSINDYGEGIKKLLLDIAEDMKNDIKDGVGIKLAAQNGDEASVYSFLKNQGYEINYKDFLLFQEDSKKIVNDNEEAIKGMIAEQKSEELSDSDLEQVAGGMNWWQWLLVGIGAALVIAAITIVTCGIGTAVATIATTAGITSGAVGAAVATANVVAGVGAVVGAVGVGAIVAGTATK